MSFRDASGSRVVLRGMSTGALRVASMKRMEPIFSHSDVAYAVVFYHHPEGFGGQRALPSTDQEASESV
jgi:hypothetical protein